MNEERPLFDQNKNPSVFAKPNDPNLTANGRYNNQADNEYGGNGYDHADSQSGRYGYDHQADNQYDGNGYDSRVIWPFLVQKWSDFYNF